MTAIEAAGKQALADNRVVDVNVIDVEETPAGPRPFRLREAYPRRGADHRLRAGLARAGLSSRLRTSDVSLR